MTSQPIRPVPRPRAVVVDLFRGEGFTELLQVRVVLDTGETSPPGVVLPPAGWKTGCGHVRPGDGEPCGLGGRHRWVLAAIAATGGRHHLDDSPRAAQLALPC